MTVSIRPIQAEETEAVYQMFQDIPKEENRAENNAHGMTRFEFGSFCKKMNDRSVLNANGIKEFPDGKVPQTVYIICENDVPVGFGKFRPFLNETCIKNRAGHFSYMISPKHRGKGYATAFLSFIKDEAQKMGLTEIEGTPLLKNKASCKVIKKSGGIIKKTTEDEVTYIIKL